MANSLSALNINWFADKMQETLFTENSVLSLANTRFMDKLGGGGDVVDFSYITKPTAGTYTPGEDMVAKDLTATAETLTVSTWQYAMVYVDDTAIKQNAPISVGRDAAVSMQRIHNNIIEQAVTYEVAYALHSLDATAVGGSAGSLISLDTNNAPLIFTAANTKLNAIDAPMLGRVAIIGGHTLGVLQNTVAGRASNFGDQVLQNGYIGKLFNWDVVYNNNLYWTATLGIASVPGEGDTVTITGVKFTFNATPSGAGSVDIGNAATSLANLVACINDTGTVGTTYIQLSAESRFLLQKRGIVATDAAPVITFVGYGDIVVSETLAAAADVWSVHEQDSLFMVRGSVDLAVQIPVKVEFTRAEIRFGEWVKSLAGYGKKTFADGARKMVKVKLDAAWTS